MAVPFNEIWGLYNSELLFITPTAVYPEIVSSFMIFSSTKAPDNIQNKSGKIMYKDMRTFFDILFPKMGMHYANFSHPFQRLAREKINR